MTGKPKMAENKAGEGGSSADSHGGGQGPVTTTPPQKPASVASGAPTKTLTPRKPPVGGKGDKTAASAGKASAPKPEVKKTDSAQKVEVQPKPNPIKGKGGHVEKPPQVARPPQQPTLFTPEPGLNFYNPPVNDTESDTEGMVVDTGGETDDMTTGTKRKAKPLEDTVSSEDEVENSIDDDNGLVSDLMEGRREAEARSDELLAKLNAAQANLRLLARSKNINPAELDDHLLAAEIG